VVGLVIYCSSVDNKNFCIIRSKGDQALFGKTTRAMKSQWKVPDNRPLADFAPTIILKAKGHPFGGHPFLGVPSSSSQLLY
jgi:hypothetical protein